MKLCVLFCALFLCVSCQEENDSCKAPVFQDFWDVKKTFSELQTSTECHLSQALKDVTSSAKAMISMTTDSGKKAINSLVAQFLVKITSKTEDLKMFEGGIPAALKSLWNRESSFLKDTIMLSSAFLKLREGEGTMAKVNFGNLFWAADSVGHKYGIQLPLWAQDFVDTIQALKQNREFMLNLRTALDKGIDLVPDSVIKTMREEYDLKETGAEGKSFTALEKLNKKAIIILKFLSCKIAYTLGFPPACARSADMLDKFLETFTSSVSQRSFSSSSVTEFILEESIYFPFHLFMGSNPTSANITDFLSAFISIRSDSDSSDPSEERHEREASGRLLSNSQQINILENLFLGWNAIDKLHITEFIVDILIGFFSAIAKFKGLGIVPPQTPAREVFGEDMRDHEDRVPHKRSIGEHMEVFDVLVKCFDREWYNDIFNDVLSARTASNSHMTLGKRITKYLDQLTEHREAVTDPLVQRILDHISSANENIKLAPEVYEYLNCIEDSLGPLHEWELISKVRGVSDFKRKLVQTFEIMDIDLSEIVGVLRNESMETKLQFARNNVKETLRIINVIWGAYKYTKSNASCFGSEVCQCYNEEMKKQTWYPQLVRISGLTMELLRGLEDYDWKNLPQMVEIFINGDQTCKELGNKKCNYQSFLSLIYSFLVRILPENLLAQLTY